MVRLYRFLVYEMHLESANEFEKLVCAIGFSSEMYTQFFLIQLVKQNFCLILNLS